MNKFSIPIGPQHPLLKEPLSMLIDISGEDVLGASLRLGYVHRGIEKLSQTRNYVQNVHLIERVCGICSHIHTTTFCHAVETLLDLDVPIRAYYLRALICELERIHSHLLWLGIMAKHVGLDTIFMYTWHDRELALDIMEEITGGRVLHGANLIGGVRFDIDESHKDMILKIINTLHTKIDDLIDVLENEPALIARLTGVAPVSAKMIKKYCVVGPVARASGVDVDFRRDNPLPPYDQLDFSVITIPDGDAMSRTLIRAYEIQESIRLCEKIMNTLPEGLVKTRAPRRVPEGEVIIRSEAPRGELFYYLRSDNTDKPARLKIRTPTLAALGLLPQQLSEIQVADIPVVLAGVDLCIACADR
jgi:NADH-quinone oxidoreductase subunit D